LFDNSIGLNEKGGMDDDEFSQYIINLMMRLYPDAADIPGKRVIVKIDSGPGRCNNTLLARLRIRGILLYAGVPNTTSVSQETDRNYGQFKNVYRRNLEKYAHDREKACKSTAVSVVLIGLFVYGGVDPVTNEEYENAFQAGFSKERNLSAWAKVGAAPLTRACLDDEQVRHDGGTQDEQDPMSAHLRTIQSKNDHAVFCLNTLSYNGDKLKAKLKEKSATTAAATLVNTNISEPYSREQLNALAKATTHGQKFLVTGGAHLTADVAFKAATLNNRKREYENLEKEKKKRKAMEKRQEEGKAVLLKNKEINDLNDTDLKKLLAWYGIPAKETKNITERREKWKGIADAKIKPPPCPIWGVQEEEELERLKSEQIDMKDTEFGRLKTQRKLEFEASYKAMNKEEREKILSNLKEIDKDDVEVEQV